MATILEGMIDAYVAHGSREPMLNEETGHYIDPEFDGLCRKLASVLVGSKVTHGKDKVVRTVTRVTIKEDCATVTAVCERKTRVTDLGHNFTVIAGRETRKSG